MIMRPPTTPECTILLRKLTCGFSGVGENSHKPSLALYCVRQVVLPQQIWETLLNLIRTELEDRLLADLGANSTLHPQERLLLNGGLLDCNDLARALLKVDWTTEMKNGRLPQVCPSQPHGKHKLGYWKSGQVHASHQWLHLVQGQPAKVKETIDSSVTPVSLVMRFPSP